MPIYQALLLGLLQGSTEFLPVSSSGHLVLAEALFQNGPLRERGVFFEVLVHIGTLVPILFVFRERLFRLLRYAFGQGWRVASQNGIRAALLREPDGRLIVAILLATIATGLIGVVGKDRFEHLFSRPDLVGWALCVTAVLLAASGFVKDKPASATPEAPLFPLWKALLIGIVQGLAITPGISRSGATIAVALLLGMNRRTAGEFSFLIAIPAIVGALILEARDFDPGSSGVSLPAGAVGFLAAAISGYIFLRLLLRIVRHGKFQYFAPYCLVVGIWAIYRF